MNREKIKEITSDEAFLKSLFELETAAEVQAALKERGLELTEEEIYAILGFLIKVESDEITLEQLEEWNAQLDDGELPEELLEQVSGGITVFAVMLGLAKFAVGASVVGLAVGTAVMLYVLIDDAIERRW